MSERSSPDPTRERRPSTGGKPPRRSWETHVIEPVPSHHDPSVPGFTVWSHDEPWEPDDEAARQRGPPTVECAPAGRTRPRWSFQFYDTTPGSDSAEHLKAIAKVLYRNTWRLRSSPGEKEPERYDVWGLPMEDGVGEEERVERCREHAIGEAAARLRAGVEGWEVPDLVKYYYDDEPRLRRKIIFVIDRPREGWDEEEGGFLDVSWNARPDYEMYMRGEAGGAKVFWDRENFEDLECSLLNYKDQLAPSGYQLASSEEDD